jgi:hypothetical protein
MSLGWDFFAVEEYREQSPRHRADRRNFPDQRRQNAIGFQLPVKPLCILAIAVAVADECQILARRILHGTITFGLRRFARDGQRTSWAVVSSTPMTLREAARAVAPLIIQVSVMNRSERGVRNPKETQKTETAIACLSPLGPEENLRFAQSV